MVSSPGEKFRRYGAFKPFDRPISPIAPALQDDPAMFLKLNEDWVNIANGALGALARPETWDTTTPESSLEFTQDGHEIMSLWQPWSEHVSVPDWEIVNHYPGFSTLLLSQRGEGLTGPFHCYVYAQGWAYDYTFRDRNTLADVGGLITYCVGYNSQNAGDQIVVNVTPCNGVNIPLSSFFYIDVIAQLGGPFEMRRLEAFTDAPEMIWTFVLKNNWTCGQV